MWFSHLKESLKMLLPQNPLALLIANLLEPNSDLRISLKMAHERFGDIKIEDFVIDTIVDELPKPPLA